MTQESIAPDGASDESRAEGWYPNPDNPKKYRYWDGQRWRTTAPANERKARTDNAMLMVLVLVGVPALVIAGAIFSILILPGIKDSFAVHQADGVVRMLVAGTQYENNPNSNHASSSGNSMCLDSCLSIGAYLENASATDQTRMAENLTQERWQPTGDCLTNTQSTYCSWDSPDGTTTLIFDITAHQDAGTTENYYTIQITYSTHATRPQQETGEYLK